MITNDQKQEKLQIQEISVYRKKNASLVRVDDMVAIEAPLQIKVNHKPISVTMRTPGDDASLAVGFLFTEGLIHHHEQVASVIQVDENTINILLEPDVEISLITMDRNFYTTSSCGVCGKSAVDAIFTKTRFPLSDKKILINDEILFSLQEKLLSVQSAFESTGGLHASAVFYQNGGYKYHSEDVGRHNALDKLIGRALMAGRIPLCEDILLLSGRASFELIQKATMAGIPIIVAVGAPSSLAIELAEKNGHTLIGFLKKTSYNIYSGTQRVYNP